jgi:DNA transposition AAA+ family ATPase
MLVLDEAQHLVDYRRNGAYEAADWIKSLMNETSIAFVLIGLKRTENLLLANEQLRRRFRPRWHTIASPSPLIRLFIS